MSDNDYESQDELLQQQNNNNRERKQGGGEEKEGKRREGSASVREFSLRSTTECFRAARSDIYIYSLHTYL